MSYVPSPFNENILWIKLKPKSIKYSKSDIFNVGDQVTTKSEGGPIHLVAPESFMDQVNHTWEPLENVGSRLVDKYAGIQRELSQSSEQHKADTALLYSDSDRRQISLTVQLAAKEDPQKEILDIVEFLKRESCPTLSEDMNTKVGIPTIFDVRTYPYEIFAIRNAALTSVQPTYYAPFFTTNAQGPSRCELTLEFKDIEPLDKARVAQGAKQTVTTSVS